MIKKSLPAHVWWAILGTFFEYFEYGLYGFMAGAIADEFFGFMDTDVHQLLAVFTVFASSSFAKPIGAFFWGRISDLYGRRITLSSTLVGMACVTLCIGLLPSYNNIGWVSPFMMLIFRFSQGFFMAGEYDTASAYIYEHAGRRNQAYGISLINAVSILGITAASLASWVLNIKGMPYWTWRMGFFISAMGGFFVAYNRKKMYEPQKFDQHRLEIGRWEVIKKNIMSIVGVIFFTAAVGSSYHFSFIFLPRYVEYLAPGNMQGIVSISLIVYVGMSIAIGAYTRNNQISRVLQMGMVGTVAFLGVLSLLRPAYWGYYPFISAFILPLYSSIGYMIVLKAFTLRERVQCASIGHTIGSIISGATPAVCFYLFNKMQIENIPFIYLIFVSLLGVIGAHLLSFKNK